MKKIAIIASSIILIFTSCNKEDDEVMNQTPTQTTQNCNCGKIISDDVSNYSIKVRNYCTQNIKDIILYEGDWMTAYVGDTYCE